MNNIFLLSNTIIISFLLLTEHFLHCVYFLPLLTYIILYKKKATIYFNRVGKDDLVGYLGLRGLSIPISLEIDAEVNNESQGYLLLATCLPIIIMPAVVVVVVSQETTLHKFKLQSFPPFLTPPPSLFLFFSFLFFWVGLGGGIKAAAAVPPKGGCGGRSLPHPPTCTCGKK